MDQDRSFDLAVNRLGKISSIAALLFMAAAPLYITWAVGISPDTGKIFTAIFNVAVVFIPVCCIENISYYPVLGAGGLYLSCITGNILNMKLPASVSGMNIAGVNPGSKEGEVISILCIAISSITTAVILFIGMLGIGFLAPWLESPVLKPGFDNVMPALMGALSVPFFFRDRKLSAAPLIIAVAMCFILGPVGVQRSQSFIMPLVMVISVFVAWILYKKRSLER
ncbi:MAG: hypothetical protein LBR61_14190 [Synergistaceae bacterium]|nr:hypothetical protein [Synergistaceae bacterium]